MAENCSGLQPWIYKSPFDDVLGMSEAFSRDTETLTRALQISMASPSSHSPSPDHSSSVSPAPTAPPVDPDTGSGKRAVVAPGPSGKVSKRKSRASMRSPTTFITADPANFRQMVQEVTGARHGDEAPPVGAVVSEPAPPKSAFRTGGARGRVEIPETCLPTLDTSAFLLPREAPRATSKSVGHRPQQQTLAVTDAGLGLFDVDAAAAPFQQRFPTLESWGVM